MKLRQKLSIFSGLLLPSLALSAYFLLAPARTVAAYDCDAYAPCFNNGCGNGTGECNPNGSDNYGYVYCSDGMDGNGGPGQCSAGCVSCDFGLYQ